MLEDKADFCRVTTLLDSGKSPGRMATVESISISVCDSHSQESINCIPRKRSMLVHRS